MAGTYIPKSIFRPYLIMGETNSEILKMPYSGDKKNFLLILSLISYLLLAYSSIEMFLFENSSKIYMFIFPISIIIILVVAITNKKLSYSRFIYFNRKENLISHPISPIGKKVLTAPWSEWSASIQLGGTYSGATLHRLWLNHNPSGHGWELMSTSAGVDTLLGLWSFIVQFMDKEGPYPNVPELADQQSLTDGLGTWEEWKIKIKQPGFVDPYFEWKMELEKNPELAPTK